MRTILKNIIITLLLIVVICLILCLIFYNEAPIFKEIPSEVDSYSTSNSVQSALLKEIASERVTNDPVELTRNHLDVYDRSNVFHSGKMNPFGNMTVQTGLVMPEEYKSTGGGYQDNLIMSEGYSNVTETGASSSSSSAGRTIDYQTTNTSTSSSQSTDNFYKSKGIK